MAFQLLYSFWRDNGDEKVFCAMSKGVAEEDVAYILRHTVKHISFHELSEDSDNPDHACTTYLRLPSGAVAIMRTGYYALSEMSVKDGFLLHAYITENGEKISPFLYAVNTCFKQSLTRDELESYSSYTLLPAVAFPRPQFVLNQREIQKFFSKGRQRILSQLLQALIDGYRSKRVTILNEKHSFLKYWFYAIHCCLPEHIKKDITFSTSSYDKSEDCSLICGAADNRISTANEMLHGNFVFDHIGGQSTENIEAVKYPVFISQLFAENAEAAFEISKEINSYMSRYNLSLSTSAGVMKLLGCEFDWFDSAYSIQFFLSKITFANKEQIENVIVNLWNCFKENAYQFPINEQALPLLSYLFKNSGSEIKREIIEYADCHHEQFGICENESLQVYYADVIEKLGFIYDFMPSALLRNNQFDDYCDYTNRDLRKLFVLLYVMVDYYPDLIQEYGEESVHSVCRKVFLMMLKQGKSHFVIDFSQKAKQLPDVFVEQVLVRGVWIYAERKGSDRFYWGVDEKLVFEVMEEFIERPRAASALLMVFARKGRYGENTVSLYMNLCRRYPQETVAVEGFLSRREAFASFMADIALQKFMEQKSATLDDLTHFFYHFYLEENDQDLSFENKVQELLDSLVPVLQIEAADHLLRLFADSCSDYCNRKFVRVLASYVVDQSVNDIYDYYVNSDVDIRLMTDILLVTDYPISNDFYAAILCVDLKNIVLHDQKCAVKISSKNLISELCAPYVVAELPVYNEENKLFLDRLYRYLLRAMLILSHKKGKCVNNYSDILKNFMCRNDFQDALATFVMSFEESDEISLDPILVSLLLLQLHGELPSENVCTAYTAYLMSGSLEKRKECFRGLLEYASCEEEKEQIKEYLTSLYFSDLNFVQKILTVSPKNLFR